jgi:hypothetical protein
MSVEDRLRRGLEANARAFTPESEQRLVEVRRRHRARTGAIAAGMAVIVVIVAAATNSLMWRSNQSSSPDPAPMPTQAATSATTYTGPSIPDSGWRKIVTRAELVDAGADDAFLADNIGSAARLPLTLSFIGGVYSQSGRYPGGWRVGDAGTLEYDPDGRLVLISTAPECRGCVTSLAWRFHGDRLMLDDVEGTPDDPITQVMLEGSWTRFGS